MSVQLILKPQNVQGFSNVITAIDDNVVSNGLNFTDLNSSGTYTAPIAYDYTDVWNNAFPSTPNTWYRYTTDGASAPAMPTVNASQNVVITNISGGAPSGIYQRLTGLVVGQVYDVDITIGTAAPGTAWNIIHFDSQGNFNTDFQIADNASNPSQFTATSVNDDIILIAYSTTLVNTIQLYSITIIGAIELVNILSGDGSVICDLYEDEDLPLSLSVDDFKNVAEKVQSYSKAFKLPATKRNNRIFDNIFEITRAYDGLIFNPYRRTECVLKQDGFILFEGFLRLLEVTDKEGEISFNVNLYSEVVAVADVLKDRTFEDLGFYELEHKYNITNIKNSWNDTGTGINYDNASTSGFRDANSTVKYPFCNWTNQFVLSNGTTLGAVAGGLEITTLEQAFRPWINIKYIIDRIFSNPEVPFTYTSNFFESSDFTNLYMDFNWGSDGIPTTEENGGTGRTGTSYSVVISSSTYVIIPIDINDYPSSVGYATGGVFTADLDNQTYNLDYDWKIASTSGKFSGRILVTRVSGATEIVDQIDLIGTTAFTGLDWASTATIILDDGDTLQFQAAAPSGIVTVYDNGTGNLLTTGLGGERVLVNVSGLTYSNNTIGQTLRGELGQWEFLKGIMTMFNLITLVDEDNPNNIKIEPYSDVFINNPNSVNHDWTDRIDVSQMKLKPLTDLNANTSFQYVEDEDDSAMQQYKKQVGGYLYGSLLQKSGEHFNILQGTKEIIAEPFANTLVKPWSNWTYANFPMPQLYAMSDDGESEGFENSPRIMYNNGLKDTGYSYFVPEQNGGASSNESDYLLFSHLTDVPTSLSNPPVSADTRDFNFGVCQMFNLGNSPANNLYALYWKPYFDELYNPDTRIMTIKVNLSPSDINTFKFNDTVFLKNRVFRVNKIDYKPNDLATVEFILIP